LRSDRERLFDILDAVERIEAQAARGHAAFAGDELAQTDLPKLGAQVRAIVEAME
jgi:uncharacterized protein with HEPN domain